ncbi:PEP-CTERM sorting domain-containing protein [Pirellulales bacterium]|nr:PEP-CTERM sorting domain-containing protein [Pirellulales bacterium]
MGRKHIGLLGAAVLTLGIIGASTANAGHLFDPFGGAGNQSLVLDNHDGGGNPVSWPFVSWDFGDRTEVTIEFDLFMAFSDRANPPSPTTSGLESWWTYVDLRVGDTDGGVPNTLENTAIFDSMRVEVGSGAFYFDNAVAPGNGHPMLSETAQHVKYDINLNTSSYTVEVTQHAIGGETNVQRTDDVNDNPVRNLFILGGPTGTSTTIDTIALGSAWNPGVLNATPFYLDNVLITSGGNTLIDEDFDDDPLGGLADTPSSHFAGAQDQNGNGFTVEIVGQIPEPSTMLLALLASTAGFAGVRRR